MYNTVVTCLCGKIKMILKTVILYILFLPSGGCKQGDQPNRIISPEFSNIFSLSARTHFERKMSQNIDLFNDEINIYTST